MATVSIKKGTFLLKAGQPVEKLYLLLKGILLVSFPGGEYTLSTGEVPGIYSLYTGLHDMSCMALEDCSLLELPVSDMASLETFFKESTDYSVLLLRSAFRQMNNLLQIHELAQLTCSNLYTDFMQDYENYQNYCLRHNLSPVVLKEAGALVPFTEEAILDFWSSSYYDGFLRFLSSGNSPLSREPAIVVGLLANACADSAKVIHSIRSLALYQKQIINLYLSETQNDLFTLYAGLYTGSETDNSAEIDFLYASITHICGILKGSPYASDALYEKRFASLAPLLARKQSEEPAADSPLAGQLTGSLEIILDYADMDDDFRKDFKGLVSQYKRTPDKASADDAVRELRLKITSAFYKLYTKIFFLSQKEASIPLPVRLFLYFGYVDEDLAGAENTAFLCHAAQILSQHSIPNVYTFYDWLTAIYTGRKEPCRNEFDEDYNDFIHARKVAKEITAQQENELSADLQKKAEYELANMFPSVNKITFGRISAFCPIFSAHNLLKRPDAALVSGKELTRLLKDITAIDFSAFYHEYLYTNTAAGIPKEMLHTEVLPDIILMPNIGTRSVMWQEIEGRRRSTPARMMLPVFYLEDLRTAMVRLSGEYRWEMCKRIQGAHWNDISERSLTSEYFDYIQFYRKNHDLSPEAKDRIKSSLQKARNSFKEMFVQDYMTYILYESAGSPRLSKPARTILFTYCPFAGSVRNALKTNPIYKETIERYDIHLSQQLRKLDLLEKRVGASVPDELLSERSLLER
ncbi:MAG: cyclic nucleotide-binding domain-containing protein [Lachnospiraceae bacterium]